jgi:hypothetical protein
LTPAHGYIAVERKKAGRRTALYHFMKRGLVLAGRRTSIGAADPPIHAPTIVASTALAKELLERGPKLRRKRADG